MIERGEEREVLSTRMRVMALEDVMVTKLLALDETHLDFAGSLEIARPLREQVDWDEVRERTRDSPVREGVLHARRGARRLSSGRP